MDRISYPIRTLGNQQDNWLQLGSSARVDVQCVALQNVGGEPYLDPQRGANDISFEGPFLQGACKSEYQNFRLYPTSVIPGDSVEVKETSVGRPGGFS